MKKLKVPSLPFIQEFFDYVDMTPSSSHHKGSPASVISDVYGTET